MAKQQATTCIQSRESIETDSVPHGNFTYSLTVLYHHIARKTQHTLAAHLPACPNQHILDIIARQAARQQQHQHHHSFNSSSPLSPSHVSVDRSVCFSARLSLYLRLLFAIRATHHELTEILLFLHNPTIIPFGGHPNYVFVSSRRIGTKPISKCLSLAGWSHFFSVLSTDAVWLQFVRITRFNDWLVVVL